MYRTTQKKQTCILALTLACGATQALVGCDEQSIDDELRAVPELASTGASDLRLAATDADAGESGETGDANASEPEPPPSSLQSKPDPVEGGCSSVCDAFTASAPVNCEWERESTTTADDIDVECASGFHPIAGSCFTNDAGAYLQFSMANEGALENMVNDDQAFWDGPSGWSCDWSKAPDAGENHIGAALCCAAVQVTQCSC